MKKILNIVFSLVIGAALVVAPFAFNSKPMEARADGGYTYTGKVYVFTGTSGFWKAGGMTFKFKPFGSSTFIELTTSDDGSYSINYTSNIIKGTVETVNTDSAIYTFKGYRKNGDNSYTTAPSSNLMFIDSAGTDLYFEYQPVNRNFGGSIYMYPDTGSITMSGVGETDFSLLSSENGYTVNFSYSGETSINGIDFGMKFYAADGTTLLNSFSIIYKFNVNVNSTFTFTLNLKSGVGTETVTQLYSVNTGVSNTAASIDISKISYTIDVSKINDNYLITLKLLSYDYAIKSGLDSTVTSNTFICPLYMGVSNPEKVKLVSGYSDLRRFYDFSYKGKGKTSISYSQEELDAAKETSRTEGYNAGYTAGKADGTTTGYTQAELDAAKEEARTEGYNSGYTARYTAGKADGTTTGYTQEELDAAKETSRTEGYNAGYAAGKADGTTTGYTQEELDAAKESSRTEGYNAGYAAGKADGTTTGFTQAQLDAAKEAARTEGYNAGYAAGLEVNSNLNDESYFRSITVKYVQYNDDTSKQVSTNFSPQFSDNSLILTGVYDSYAENSSGSTLSRIILNVNLNPFVYSESIRIGFKGSLDYLQRVYLMTDDGKTFLCYLTTNGYIQRIEGEIAEGAKVNGIQMNLPRATDSLGEVKVFIRSGAYSNIYMEGFSDGEVYGYDNTYPIAYDKGFTDGSNELISVNWLSSFLSGFGSILDKNILGSIKLWHLVAFPLLLGAVFLIFKFIK